MLTDPNPSREQVESVEVYLICQDVMCLRFVYKTDSLMVMLLNLWGKLVAVCCGLFGNRNWHLEDLLIMVKVETTHSDDI